MMVFWNNVFDIIMWTCATDIALLVLLIILMFLEMKIKKIISKIVWLLSRIIGWMAIFKIIVAIVTLIHINKDFEKIFLLSLVIVCYMAPPVLIFENTFKKLALLLGRKFKWIKLQ